jgi:hypothetical protein
MSAFLHLNRMSVFKGAGTLYSQVFHDGVNIIHGDNGSGKSTLMDFIFFGMGGDLTEWKPHAEKADFVLLEVKAGGTILTLRRDVASQTGRPMQIYFGPMDEAIAAGPIQWRAAPYKREKDNFSFSQVLFRAIGLPEAISDGTSNITMHQILRLLYSDQMTPIQRIFRIEHFDTWQTRQAVGDLMCGIGGYELFDKQLMQRTTSREHDELSSRLRNLIAVASGYGDAILAEHIEVTLKNIAIERTTLASELDRILVSEAEPKPLDDEATALMKRQSRTLTRARRAVAELEDRVSTLEYEIEDSAAFIGHLEKTLEDFDDAATTFFALGQVRFEFCPACFAPVISEGKDPANCHLCGEAHVVSSDDTKSLAVRLDIEMQLRESRVLQGERTDTLETQKTALRRAQKVLREVSEAYELSRRGHATEREKLVADISRKIGYIDSETKILQDRLTLAGEIAKLSAEKERLNGIISRLKDEIAAIIQGQLARKRVAYTLISDRARGILDQDLAEHADFGEVKFISFSFADDWIAINDDKNHSRSASGMVVLKNSFHFGLFLAALQDATFGLPRFMLLDNIEDKGMVQDRVWNFQRVLVAECLKQTTPHQLIFTTSRLAPDLDKPELVIGRKYTRNNPSLEFSQAAPAL